MLRSLTLSLSMLVLAAPMLAQSNAIVRAELEKAYKENADAFVHSNLGAVMALRAPAIAIVSQHLDRMALRPDNQAHHVETWVTQRETWVKPKSRWLLWRVDQLRNQRRLVDGQSQ